MPVSGGGPSEPLPPAHAAGGVAAPGGGSPGLRGFHGFGEATDRLSLDGPSAAELKHKYAWAPRLPP
jgi:hypothetical protein